MKPETRLILCVGAVLGSVGYATLVAFDEGLASAVALGYVAILLTVYIAIHFGKKNHDRYSR